MTAGRGALLVALVCALLVLPPVGQRIVAVGDEARFALLARDMLARGAWFEARLRGELYRNKPPLYPWSIAVLSVPGGKVTATTAHLPVALAAVAAAALAALLGERLFGRRAGLWAGLILITTYAFFGHSQVLLPDMIVLAFVLLAACAFWTAVGPAADGEPAAGAALAGAAARRRALVAFHAALALGVFAKGPIGLLPLLVGGIWLLSERGPRGLLRLWSPAGLGVFCAVTAVWLGPFLLLGAGTYARAVVAEDWLAWYLGRPIPARLGNLAVDALVGFLPWTLVAVPAVGAAARALRAPALRFAFLWLVVPLAVVVLAENQRTRYLLPIYPGAALLTAWWADTHGASVTRAARTLGWIGLLAAAAAIAALAAPEWLPADQRPFAPGWSWLALPAAGAAALLGIALWRGLRRGRPAFLVNGVALAMVVILGYGIWPYTERFNAMWDFRTLAALAERHARGGSVGAFGGRWFSLDFYLGRWVEPVRTVEAFERHLARADRPVLVINGRTWAAIQGQYTRQVRVLERMKVGGQDMLVLGDGGP